MFNWNNVNHSSIVLLLMVPTYGHNRGGSIILGLLSVCMGTFIKPGPSCKSPSVSC